MDRRLQPLLRRIKVRTRIGTFLLTFSPKGLYAVRLPASSSLRPCGRLGVARHKGSNLRDCHTPAGPAKTGGLNILSHKLRYAKLDLTDCTPFQLKVYAALREVPAGKTVTYGELAKRAGYPGAARAVGTAMKKNRLPIVIPCHRVVPASGGLGEYSAGVKWKRWLLEHEGCCVA